MKLVTPVPLLVLVLVLVLALASCAEPSTAAGHPNGSSSPARAASGPTVVYAAVGASETVGIGAEHPTSDSWPQVFYRTALPQTAVYYNFGIPGDLAMTATTDQAPEALGQEPNLVTIWLNVNDLLAGVSASRYEVYLGQLVHGLRRNGAATVLVANTPQLDRLPAYLACHGGPVNEKIQCSTAPAAQLPPAAVNALVDQYNAAIARVVIKEGAVLVDLHAQGEVPDIHPEFVSGDGFHPNAAGYRAVAGAFADAYRARSVAR
ncbi:MAG: SGNH/GDSL hydrolase family protein [Candidatus Dormibacteria bacterium]